MKQPDDALTPELLARHIIWCTIAIGALGAVVAFAWRGRAAGLSFTLGVAGAVLNIWFFKSVANALGPTNGPPLRGSKGALILRILLIGLATFAILRTSEIVVPALLLGLLASAAAVFLEILYLLIFYART